jgi:phthalate 4,5-dioxygenase oxygenase subunit
VDTEYGVLVGARRDAEEDSYYWRITQFLLPSYTMIPGALEPGRPLSGHVWVPIDDETVWTFSMTWNPTRPFTDEEVAELHHGNGIHTEVDAEYRPVRNKRNNYMIDRQVQKARTYTGIKGISEQDMAVQEGMGPVVDRSREHLGTSDTAIIAFRRLLLNLAKDLQKGQEPFDEGAKAELAARV